MLILLIVGLGYRLIVRLPYDIYMMMTMAPPNDPTDPFYEDEGYKNSLVTVFNSYLSYATLRIAVYVNLLRWIILYLGLRV